MTSFREEHSGEQADRTQVGQTDKDFPLGAYQAWQSLSGLGLSKAALPCTGEVYQLPSSLLKQNTQQKQFKKRKVYLGLEFLEIDSIMTKHGAGT